MYTLSNILQKNTTSHFDEFCFNDHYTYFENISITVVPSKHCVDRSFNAFPVPFYWSWVSLRNAIFTESVVVFS